MPTVAGSPPRMRGKHFSDFFTLYYSGITPAGAGKTFILPRQATRHRDHPRRCGENPRCGGFLAYCLGSPPQVRGKLASRLLAPACVRITPAGAGKTALTTSASAGAWDHPRRCGENTGLSATKATKAGSPPQVRGKLFNLLSIIRKNRITPAGAGKTLPSCWHSGKV